MWLLFALGSALFAGATSILAKVGIKNVDSHLATAMRTVVVLLFAWLMVFVVGSQNTIGDISARTLLFLGLSGLTTGTSWICYFRALSLGDVNKVVPVDKSSVLLTMLAAALFLGEPLGALKIVCMALIGLGTWLMIEKKQSDGRSRRGWLLWAAGSAVFAAATAILGKLGIAGVESNLGTALRTVVVLAMAWAIVFAQGTQKQIGKIDRRSLLFIVLSGVATGLSWLCYYRALQTGEAGLVVPIDKLSIIITVAFSYFALGEKLSRRALAGLVLIVAGTLLLLV